MITKGGFVWALALIISEQNLIQMDLFAFFPVTPSLVQVILPLSKSILVVIVLYYLVAHWNSYFEAMMYLRDSKLYPLQVLLRQILLLSQMGDMAETMGVNDTNTMLIYAALKYAIIVISAVPLLVLYPMIQRFFEKGIMMGSIKGW